MKLGDLPPEHKSLLFLSSCESGPGEMPSCEMSKDKKATNKIRWKSTVNCISLL